MPIKRSAYNIALGSQGYVLAGIPNTPARTQKQAPIYGTRFAMGDRTYSDFSQYWFWAQTDFAAGFQDEYWKDNARIKSCSNVDPLSVFGEIAPLFDLTSIRSGTNLYEFKTFTFFNNKIYIL